MRTVLCCAAVVFLTLSVLAQAFDFSSNTVVVTPPFVVTNQHLVQPCQTALPESGQLSYRFSVAATNTYAIQARVKAPYPEASSFYVNIDGQPSDPEMIWDIPVSTNFETRVVGWRGKGTPENPEFRNKTFLLGPGQHELIIRGRAAGTELESLSLVARPLPPSGLHIQGSQPPAPPTGLRVVGGGS